MLNKLFCPDKISTRVVNIADAEDKKQSAWAGVRLSGLRWPCDCLFNHNTGAASAQTRNGVPFMSDITIYHNPACGTSRNTLALIRNSGAEPAVILYLEPPPPGTRLKS